MSEPKTVFAFRFSDEPNDWQIGATTRKADDDTEGVEACRRLEGLLPEISQVWDETTPGSAVGSADARA